jgi:hypothetical protein
MSFDYSLVRCSYQNRLRRRSFSKRSGYVLHI